MERSLPRERIRIPGVHVLSRYGLALFSLGLAIVIQSFDTLIGDATPFLLALTLVTPLAWYCGLVAGLVAALSAAFCLGYFVLPPEHVLLDPAKDARLAVFVLLSGLIISLIEGHKRAERRWRKSEERFRAVYENAAIGLGQLTLDGHLMAANDKLCEILGYTREELLQRTFMEITLPEDLAEENRYLTTLLAGEIPSYVLEKRYLRKGGDPVWVRVTSSLAGSPGTQGTYRISVIEDISERKRAQEAERFLIEASSVLASSLDYATTLDHLSHLAVPTLADWCAVDIVGEDEVIRPLSVAHRDPEKVEWARELRRRDLPDPEAPRGAPAVIRTGQSELYPMITDALLVESSRDAEQLALLRQVGFSSAMVVPLVARGRTLGALSLITAESGRHYGAHDLVVAEDTARRAAVAIDNARLFREVQEADRQKDEFLAMLGHELRTPLGIVLNSLEAVKGRVRGQEDLERLRARIERQIQRIARLIDDMQDVTRISRGAMVLEREEMDLGKLVREVADDHRHEIEGAGLKFTVEVPSETATVNADPIRLAQVLVNLLNNATKFTDPGGIVTLALFRDDDWVSVTVRDTGIGMDAEMLPHVFKSFTQEARSLERSRGGLGLGLALVEGLVALHGGKVSASSPGSGRGSEFTFQIPHVGNGDEAAQEGQETPVVMRT